MDGGEFAHGHAPIHQSAEVVGGVDDGRVRAGVEQEILRHLVGNPQQHSAGDVRLDDQEVHPQQQEQTLFVSLDPRLELGLTVARQERLDVLPIIT